MKVRALLTSTLVAFAACGHPSSHDPALHEVRQCQPQQWQGSDTLAANKKTVVNAARSLGCDDHRVALLLACGMLETDDLSASQRDQSKDGDGHNPARNFSAFNMNLDALNRIGMDFQKMESLNVDANLAEAVKAFNDGLNKFGEDPWLSFHRGGAAALADGTSYGAAQYREVIRTTQAWLIANQWAWLDRTRSASFVPHV